MISSEDLTGMNRDFSPQCVAVSRAQLHHAFHLGGGAEVESESAGVHARPAEATVTLVMSTGVAAMSRSRPNSRWSAKASSRESDHEVDRQQLRRARPPPSSPVVSASQSFPILLTG